MEMENYCQQMTHREKERRSLVTRHAEDQKFTVEAVGELIYNPHPITGIGARNNAHAQAIQLYFNSLFKLIHAAILSMTRNGTRELYENAGYTPPASLQSSFANLMNIATLLAVDEDDIESQLNDVNIWGDNKNLKQIRDEIRSEVIKELIDTSALDPAQRYLQDLRDVMSKVAEKPKAANYAPLYTVGNQANSLYKLFYDVDPTTGSNALKPCLSAFKHDHIHSMIASIGELATAEASRVIGKATTSATDGMDFDLMLI